MVTVTRISADTDMAPPVSRQTSADSRNPTMSDADIVSHLRETLSRLAQISASAIRVTAANHVVTMHGHVRCWSEWHIVERVAWSTPSVAAVHNNLLIHYGKDQS